MNSSFTKLDMHVHSEYSKDSNLKLSTISKFLDKNKEFGIVLSDHNEIDGALELAKSYPDRVIVGVEIRTDEGEVTGLFLNEKIPARQKIDWTLDAILSQGGVIYIPHPMDRLRTSRLTEKGLKSAIAKADILEIFNSRNVFDSDDKKALELAKEHNIILGCGSDAHTRWELGSSFMHFDETFELTPMTFLDALENAKPVCKRSFIGVHFITKAKKIGLKYKKD